MSLPPPSSGVYWKNWEINTPTFQLTPIEKPDMSPFLIHMTGKNEIINILQGRGTSDEIPGGHGFLQANIPEATLGGYDARVVCFTESPTFALDFFRYRRFSRWQKDQRFGIGFDKSQLVSQGARPVIYVDEGLHSTIMEIKRHAERQGYQVSTNDPINSVLYRLITTAYPLLFPLLENTELQGFMWEREWRIPKDEGFLFDYSLIRVICCPEEEEPGIRKILGEYVDYITFVRTWQEYDDITNYLTSQQMKWREQQVDLDAVNNPKQTIEKLRKLIYQQSLAINNLDLFFNFASKMGNEAKRVEDELKKLREQMGELNDQLKNLEEKAKEAQENLHLDNLTDQEREALAHDDYMSSPDDVWDFEPDNDDDIELGWDGLF